jgi:glycosyltransferase involved in cell wall biosynthesis
MTTYDTVVRPADWLCQACLRKRSEHTCLGGFERRRYQFVAMLRVRNEARWIAEVLESIRPLCERIFVMDDHSTDETVEICKRFAPLVIVTPSPFEGLNESRDKNWLYDQILQFCEPEWILCIDGDEVLEKNGPAIIRDRIFLESLSPHGGTVSFKLAIAFLWNGRETVRTDRIYGDFWRPSLFRPFIPDPNKPDDLLVAQEFRFKATPFGRHIDTDKPNLHCSSVPQRRIHGAKMLPVRLKHYGYMWREDRVQKLDYYTSIDWKNQAEDCYRHMCQGDTPLIAELPKVRALVARGELTQADVDFITRVPDTAVLMHAGPLKLEPWDEEKSWEMSAWARSQG